MHILDIYIYIHVHVYGGLKDLPAPRDYARPHYFKHGTALSDHLGIVPIKHLHWDNPLTEDKSKQMSE